MTRALIIEPDPGIRKLQQIILRQHAGVDEIVERSSVAEALGVFASEHFDFSMIDVSFATVDVERISEELREFLRISSREQRSPVIAFTTGVVPRETLKLLVGDHVFAVFPKPFDISEVVASVHAALEATTAGTLYPKFHGFLERKHDGKHE